MFTICVIYLHNPLISSIDDKMKKNMKRYDLIRALSSEGNVRKQH